MAPRPTHILNGYRVLDMTHVLAGPTATRLMAEMGAEVIKVEFPPLGDVARTLPAQRNGRSAYYVQQNRGKESLCLNAKSEEGKSILRELIKKSDVFIENFAPGVIGRNERPFVGAFAGREIPFAVDQEVSIAAKLVEVFRVGSAFHGCAASRNRPECNSAFDRVSSANHSLCGRSQNDGSK